MRPLFWFLCSALLTAQDPPPIRELVLDRQASLGGVPFVGIRLVAPGCWDGLILGTSRRPVAGYPRRTGEATVEVWDLLPPDSPRQEAFALYLGQLRERLSRAFAQPPPTHGALELSDLMTSDPSNPQVLDLTKVKSMQERFNRLPPNGSPVK